jgi:hypothetical protein
MPSSPFARVAHRSDNRDSHVYSALFLVLILFYLYMCTGKQYNRDHSYLIGIAKRPEYIGIMCKCTDV